MDKYRCAIGCKTSLVGVYVEQEGPLERVMVV